MHKDGCGLATTLREALRQGKGENPKDVIKSQACPILQCMLLTGNESCVTLGKSLNI